MAAPVVSGSQRLVWSRYPDLSSQELKAMLMGESKVYLTLLVKKPSSPEDLIPFQYPFYLRKCWLDAEAISQS
ncbi:S8 family serine peptidase [Vibrio lentus]|nr:S8 family serine peptidase [Vibrio lentus]